MTWKNCLSGFRERASKVTQGYVHAKEGDEMKPQYNHTEKPKVIIITGPTAVGKTAASVQLAQQLKGEIISADSMQIYKYMDIGTAKPATEEKQGIPHHLMDFLEPDQRFTVVDFQEKALVLIKDIHDRKSIPIVIGGTGLYLHSLLYRLDFTEVEMDATLRQKLESEGDLKGAAYMHQQLAKMDPEAAERIHPNNVKRVIRALEVILNAEEGVKDFSRPLEENTDYDFRTFVLHENRQSLYHRINLRVDIMIAEGLEAEVKKLLHSGYDVKLPAMQGVGYKEMIRYISGEIGYEEAVEIIKRNSRRYAKRQLTWFKKWPQAHWVLIDHEKPRDQEINRVVEMISGALV